MVSAVKPAFLWSVTHTLRRRSAFRRGSLLRLLRLSVGLVERVPEKAWVALVLPLSSFRTRNPPTDPAPWALETVGRNLVDPASSHMLVSKIKPCMSQYKLLYGETANGSLKQL